MDKFNFVPDGWLDDDPTLKVEVLDPRAANDVPPSLHVPPGKKKKLSHSL